MNSGVRRQDSEGDRMNSATLLILWAIVTALCCLWCRAIARRQGFPPWIWVFGLFGLVAPFVLLFLGWLGPRAGSGGGPGTA